MTVKDILAQLESLGDETRRKHNVKAGAPENQFGAKLGDIRTLAKKIKPPKGGHKLGLELWGTGNVEGQLLATLLVEPKSLSAAELEKLVRSTTYAQVADWLQSYVVAQHPEKEPLRLKWMAAAPAKDPWAARAGWALTAGRVNRSSRDASAKDIDAAALLDRIEAEMARTRPEVQWMMNNTLMAIGIECAPHRKRAIAIGEKIGLYRDWPVSKGCTPPYAPVAINELVKRKR